jgi:ABC-type lipoprotein export system ATPase subunit
LNHAGSTADADAFTVVECIAASRIFGSGATAVRAVSLASCRVASRARIAVTGPSGSGKSTLLHLLAGLDKPSDGIVRWPALRTERGAHPRGVGMVFQGPSLLPNFDVVDNVALPMLLAGGDEHDAHRQALEALELVGMRDSASKLPDELSGGQSQRVAIARVLATRPTLIVADEPTGQLDQHNAARVIRALIDTATTTGAALLVSTHDPTVAARFDDQWTMRDGVLEPSCHEVPS